jgi:hypothetical protein
LLTLSAAAISLLFSAPAVITAAYFWIPKSVLGRLPSGSWLWNFFGLCEIAVAIGGRFYLLLAFALNVFLLFRRQATIWLRVLVWALFVVAVLGLLGVEADLRHVRH